MAKKWNFMKANGVYVYPSANADDGGDVNSEVNVSGISKHLIQKNFVIDDNKSTPKPLWVQLDNNSKFSVYHGSCIIDGYYFDLISRSSVYIISGQEINTSYLTDPAGFFTEFNSIRNQYYTVEDGHVVPKKHPKNVTIPELPMLHFIIKLVKNTTGNLRGDLLERKTDGSNILMNRACAWSILTTSELADLDVPYIDIAQFIPNKKSSPYTGNISIAEVINPDNRSSYIYIDSIYDEDGDPLSKSIENKIKEGTKSLPTITYYEYPQGEDGPKLKKLEITVKNGVPEVLKYQKKTPEEFDENGDYVVVPITNDYNGSYSIDAIQHRTHVTSLNKADLTPEERETNRIANLVDSNDNGSGRYTVPTSGGYTAQSEITGRSRLLAHADHLHDSRYLVKLTNTDAEMIQTVNTKVEFKKNLKAGSLTVSELNIDTSGNIDNGVLKTDISKSGQTTVTPENCSVQVTGSLNASGYISANRVYNAVWNDYAELYKKSYSKATYEEGTVICKVPEVDAYGESNYKDRRLVVGVVTERYGHLLGGDPTLSLEENLELYIPVAVSGRVPVRVVGHVNEGDLLVVSTCNGYATSEPYPEPGTVIGKALESNNDGKDKVLMQVMLG